MAGHVRILILGFWPEYCFTIRAAWESVLSWCKVHVMESRNHETG